MHFITILIPTILSLAGSASAWAQHSNGVWVANNVMHAIDTWQVHEACTKMNTQEFWKTGDCAYWTNAEGGIFNGKCDRWARYVNCL